MDSSTFVIEFLKVASAVLTSWAWPLALVGCLLLFKRELKALISRIKTLEAGSAKATFADALAVMEAAQAAQPNPKESAVESVEPGEGEVLAHAAQVPEQPIRDLKEEQRPSRPERPFDQASRLMGLLKQPAVVRYPGEIGEDLLHVGLDMTSSNALVIHAWGRLCDTVVGLYEKAHRQGMIKWPLHAPTYSWSALWRDLLGSGLMSSEQLFRLDELRRLANVARHATEQLPFEQAWRYNDQIEVLAAEFREVMRALNLTESQSTHPKPEEQ